MGRHAKPHNGTEQQQEPQEDYSTDEHHPSKGRHSKDRQYCTGTPGEQADAVELS